MIVINESEDMVDGLSDNAIYFNNKKQSLGGYHYEDDKEPLKSKTTNVADILKEIKNSRKGGKNIKEKFENTCDLSKLKKNSFFS